VQNGGNGLNSGDAVVSVTWSLRNVAGAEQTCPDGITVAQVIAQPVDSLEGTPEGAPLVTLFDCSAKSGTIQLDPASYLISVRLESADGDMIYASSTPSNILDLSAIDTSETFDIYTDGGYLSLSWDLIGQTGGILDCAGAGVSDIRIVLTPKSGSGSATSTQPINCPTFGGTTNVVPAGDYSLAINAEANGTTVGTFAVADSMVLAPNEVDGLGEIEIPIAGK
jgi:hypothetical protein